MQIMPVLLTGALMLSVGIYVGRVVGSNEVVAKVLAERHSGYNFDANKVVTQDQLQFILKAAQQAPSSYNDQPWNYIVCDKLTNPVAYEKAFSALVPFNQKWAINAQILILCIAATNSHQGQFNQWAQYDTGAATCSMAIQAAALGLMTHQMGGFDGDQLRQLFAIPQDCLPISVMAIGYDADRKAKVKERKPLSVNFFNGAWGNGY